MTGSEYTKLAMRTNDGECTDRLEKRIWLEGRYSNTDVGGVLDACLGLTGEAGEVVDLIKKWIFHEKPLDKEHLQKELGDCCWYLAMMCYSFGFDLDEIMQMNIDKLKARYPQGFSTERSNNREAGDV